MLRPTTGVFFRPTVVDVASKANSTSPPSVSAKIPVPAHAAAEVQSDQPDFFLKPVVLAAAATSIPGTLRTAVIKGPSTATAHPAGSLPSGANASTACPGGPLHVNLTWVAAACSGAAAPAASRVRPLRVNSNVSFANADPLQHGAAAPVASRRPLRVHSNVPFTFSERCRKPSWVTACRHARTGLCRMDFRRKPGRVTACRHARKGLCQCIRCCFCSC